MLLWVLFGLAAAAGPAAASKLELSDESLGSAGLMPVFSSVENFELEIDLAGPLVPGAVYGNDSIVLVQYIVSGSLSQNPPTPSGFERFALNRTPAVEGPITPTDWIDQGSSLDFEIEATANLSDGLQLSELVADNDGLLLAIDAREFQREDRARYHPPQLLFYDDGTGILWNSNNSSTLSTNPGNGQFVDVDFGEEYITNLAFDPALITIVVPEPGTGLLVGVGLATLGVARRRGGRAG